MLTLNCVFVSLYFGFRLLHSRINSHIAGQARWASNTSCEFIFDPVGQWPPSFLSSPYSYALPIRWECNAFYLLQQVCTCLLWALGKVDTFLVSVWLLTCDRYVLPLPGSRGPWETLLRKIPLTLVTQFGDLQNKCVPHEWFYAHLRSEYIQLLKDVSMNGKVGRLWFLL